MTQQISYKTVRYELWLQPIDFRISYTQVASQKKIVVARIGGKGWGAGMAD